MNPADVKPRVTCQRCMRATAVRKVRTASGHVHNACRECADKVKPSGFNARTKR